MKQILTILLLLSGFNMLSQEGPDIFRIEACTDPISGVNDIWVRNGMAGDGNCPCYDRQSGGIGLIRWFGGSDGWFLGLDRTCNTFNDDGTFIPFGSGTTCDIRDITFISGCSEAVLTDLTPGIPTLSQWGIIILGLLFLVFGAVALIYRNEVQRGLNSRQQQ